MKAVAGGYSHCPSSPSPEWRPPCLKTVRSLEPHPHVKLVVALVLWPGISWKCFLCVASAGWGVLNVLINCRGARLPDSHFGLSVQFSSVTQSCLTLCSPMNRSTPGLPVHHQLPEFIQTHIHCVSDGIQPPHSLLSPSPPAPNPSQHQSLFQRLNSSHEVAKVLEFQL